MVNSNNFIDPEIAEKIKDTADLKDVISDFVQLKPSGSSFLGSCPGCGGKNKLTVTPGKGIWKCFVCDEGGKDAISFLKFAEAKTYPEALNYLADRYNIAVNKTEKTTKKKRQARNISFRDSQLKESGIKDSYQKYFQPGPEDTSTRYEMDRYQSATINNFGQVVTGDDLVLNYVDLDFQPMTFKRGGKILPLTRVRWANPALKKDKNGKAIKYKSPKGSGSHLWLTNGIIKAYKAGEILETIYIWEGEKKADKAQIHGLPSVGVMGIQNFALSGEMPYQFELIIKKCGVSSVVFMLDSDYNDISIKPGIPIDQRPKNFFTAVVKYQRYFQAYANNNIELKIFFGYGKNKALKGIDDLYTRELKGKEDLLKEDIEKAMISRNGVGQFVDVHNITSMSDYKLKQFWNLDSIPRFIQSHKEKLKGLPEFQIGRLKRRFNESGEVELAQKVLPHEEYWKTITWETRDGQERKKTEFNYVNILNFLNNRGFGLYEYSPDKYRFIQVSDKVVTETSPHKIQRYIIDFTREIERLDVLEMILKGKTQYLGPDKLSSLFYRSPEFHEPEKESQFLFFKNCYWKITADGITQRPLTDLPKHIWEQNIIDFEPKYIGKPMVKIDRSGNEWKMEMTEEMKKSDMAIFYANTSNFHWKKQQEEFINSEGNKEFRVKENPGAQITKEDLNIFQSNLICKMVGAGYVLHNYMDFGNMKAIICMDGQETEVGTSQGGTGKSIWATQFEHLLPCEIIDGKKKNLIDDPHIYDSVDERTKALIFDDCRVNIDFENFLSQITRGVEVNAKGERKFKIAPPKFIFSTNHALNGDGNSFKRRQYYLSFSDYYNGIRSVGDEFGHQLFHEWDFQQWNLFYNWMATCVMVWLKFGFKYAIPADALERRRLRQEIGEDFLTWASLLYDPEDGPLINSKVEKEYLFNKFIDENPLAKKYTTAPKFKKRLRLFAKYAGLDFNPTAMEPGGRIKSNGREYFILATDKFNAVEMKTYSVTNRV